MARCWPSGLKNRSRRGSSWNSIAGLENINENLSTVSEWRVESDRAQLRGPQPGDGRSVRAHVVGGTSCGGAGALRCADGVSVLAANGGQKPGRMAPQDRQRTPSAAGGGGAA